MTHRPGALTAMPRACVGLRYMKGGQLLFAFYGCARRQEEIGVRYEMGKSDCSAVGHLQVEPRVAVASAMDASTGTLLWVVSSLCRQCVLPLLCAKVVGSSCGCCRPVAQSGCVLLQLVWERVTPAAHARVEWEEGGCVPQPLRARTFG